MPENNVTNEVVAGEIKWDKQGERFYETGVDHCVLYTLDDNGVYNNGVAWNGITAINENPSGAEATPIYADNIKYLNMIAAEDFACGIEAYTYPDAFALCDGSAVPVAGLKIGQQPRKTFGLCYRTLKGNDTKGTELGYKLHLIYGCTAAPSQKGYNTVNDSPEAITFSWDVNTVPVDVKGFKPTATFEIDSALGATGAATKEAFDALLAILYGTDGNPTAQPPVEATVPKMPLPDAIIAMFTGD